LQTFFSEPFIELVEDKYHIHNNRPTVNNEYQTARVSQLPQWGFVRRCMRRCTTLIPTNHTVHFNNNVHVANVPNADVPNEGNIVAQLQNSIPNNLPTM